MCQLRENKTFMESSGSTVLQINKEFLTGKIIKTEYKRCERCGEIAIGYDEFNIPWCYEPKAHPEDIFPMVTEIVYEIAQTA